MSRWLPTAALVAALVLSSLAGCGSSAPPTTGKGAAPTNPATPTQTGKPAESGKGTSKDPGFQPG
jgi:hypothetical protein